MNTYIIHMLNSSEPLQYPARPSGIHYPPITYGNGMGPGYHQPQSQPYCVQSGYNDPQFGSGSQGATEEVLPSKESQSRIDADLLPENARTDKYAPVSYHYTPY